MKKILSTVAAIVLVAFSSGTAHAAAFSDDSDIEIGDVTWGSVYLDDGGENQFYVDDLLTDDSTDVFDEVGHVQFYLGGDVDYWFDLYCDTADLSDATDGSGDKILTCEPMEIDTDVTATIEARFYAEGDMVRFVQTLTNGTNAAIDYDWWSWGGYGDAIDYNFEGSWEVEEGEDNGEYVGAAWGLEGAGQFPTYIEDGSDGYGASGFDGEDVYSLPAGKSVSFATFAFHNAPNSDLYPSGDFDNLVAWAADTFDAFDGRLSRGLADDIYIANWEAAEGEELADTGVNSLGLIGLASALVAAGAIAFGARRRLI